MHEHDSKDTTMVPEFLDIPIFPLPNVTLFPGTYMPLHVFEPRFRKLTKNALNGDRLVGLALLKEGWQKNYFGSPPICKTFGVGKIVDHEELDNGCFNLMLEGFFRVRLIEEFPTTAFRAGHVQVLQDPAIDGIRAAMNHMMRELRQLTTELMELMPESREPVAAALASHPHPMFVTNHLAQAVVVDAYDRQSILEQDDPLRRLNLVLVQVRGMIRQLKSDPDPVREQALEEDDLFG